MQKEKKLVINPDELTKVFRRKKTVRTTFNLKLSTLEKIAWLSKDYGYNAKKIFKLASVLFQEEIIGNIINSHKKTETEKRQRKTFLIEKDTLSFINEIFKKYPDKLSRDLIIDFGVAELAAIFKKIEEEEKEKNQKALEIVAELENLADDVYLQIETLYKESDNPVVKRVSSIFWLTQGLRQDIENAINEGIPVEPY